MKRTWPIIGVKDVAASSAWYQALFGQPSRGPNHEDFDQITDEDGTVLLCLHEWGGHDARPPLERPAAAEPGNGILLSFLVDDFESRLARAQAMGASFHAEPQRVEGDRWWSFSLRDPDGYYISINAMQEIRALEASANKTGD